MQSHSTTRTISLSRGLVALVDEDDYDAVSSLKWSVNDSGYAIHTLPRVNGSRRVLRLHRFILGAETGQQVDHVNGDRLDCRRSNLRFCTQADNCANRPATARNHSGYKGVAWHRLKGKWVAKVCRSGKQYHLGYFTDPVAAAHAYDDASVRLHGEFARPNFG